MGFQFPNSPAVNDTFAAPGGPVYTWDGIAWKAISQGVPVTVFVSDTAPGNPAPGNLWWDSDTGVMSIWYQDADSAQWVQVSGSVSAQPTAETRNRIVNGAMAISQENGTTQAAPAATTTSYFGADQWLETWNTATGSLRGGSLATGGPDGLAYSYINVVTIQALQAGTYAFIRQNLEGIRIKDFFWGTASAKQVVLTFWVRSTVVTGTFCARIANGDVTRSYIAAFNVPTANTWQQVTLVIPGDTTGTWPNDTSRAMYLDFTCAAGSTYQGVAGWQAGNVYATSAQVNGVGTVGLFQIANVGLYLDPLATGRAPAWTMPDEAQELASCQRYWISHNSVTFSGNVTSASIYTSQRPNPVAMRTTPAAAGTHQAATMFAAAAGTCNGNAAFVQEQRTANATGPGAFVTIINANARM
jgi:hypothetical protein